MIPYDNGFSARTVFVTMTIGTGYATGDFVNFYPGDVVCNCYQMPPPPPRVRVPAPSILDRRQWLQAQRHARDRTPPHRQRRTFLDHMLKTKTLNRRFT